MEPTASPGPIAIEARLVHADPGRCVVEVSAWLQGQCLGRSLGEATSAEAAEDRARTRLTQHLQPSPIQPPRGADPHPLTTPASAADESDTAARPRPAPPQRVPAPSAPSSPAAIRTASATPPISAPADTATAATPQLPLLGLNSSISEPSDEEPVADPEDWSEELAELDVQLQRLGWDRHQEGTYLQRAFQHPSRNRLTAYADLVAYLRALRTLPSGSSPETAPVPLRRRELLSQCDQLLASLGWEPQQGRQLLERAFQLSSRQQLSDEQLLQFNMLLESELIGCGSSPAAAESPD
ncbi:MAG: hypothetical protein ACKO5M_01385 [Vulcanococcus sp.]